MCNIMSLTYELLKNCTTIVELFDVNELFSQLVDEKCKVYGLRADFGYPEHLIPKNTYKYIAYIGISNRIRETSYGQAQFIEFYYEPNNVGVLEHFFDMYLESEKKFFKSVNINKVKSLRSNFSKKNYKKNLAFWKQYLDNEYDVNDRISLRDFLDDYELTYQINDEMLYDALPENIDDLDNESEYKSESESELVECEI